MFWRSNRGLFWFSSSDEPPVIGHRTARGTMYFCIAASGVVLWFIPIAFLDSVVGFTFAAISAFLLVGGMTSMIGHYLRILVVEKAGYPLILTALVCLTGMLFSGSGEQASRLFIALLILSFAFGLYGRWRDLGALLRIQRTHREEQGDGIR